MQLGVVLGVGIVFRDQRLKLKPVAGEKASPNKETKVVPLFVSQSRSLARSSGASAGMVSLDYGLKFEPAKPRDELLDPRFGFDGPAFQVAGTTGTFC